MRSRESSGNMVPRRECCASKLGHRENVRETGILRCDPRCVAVRSRASGGAVSAREPTPQSRSKGMYHPRGILEGQTGAYELG